MEKQIAFSSKTAEVRFYIMQYVGQEEREYERKELVDYVYKMMGHDESLTAGVVAGAVKMLTCSGELVSVKRGVFKKGMRKQQSTSIERIHSVCARFVGEFEKACTVNVFSLSEEERILYPDIVETLELGRANIYELMEQLEDLLRRIKTAGVEKNVSLKLAAPTTQNGSVSDKNGALKEKEKVQSAETGTEGNETIGAKKNDKHK